MDGERPPRGRRAFRDAAELDTWPRGDRLPPSSPEIGAFSDFILIIV